MKSPMKRRKEPAEKDLSGAKERATFVYVATCEGRTKIGVATVVTLRLRQIQNGSGVPVTEVASRLFSTRISAEEIERRLHRKFHASRLHGEWFSVDPLKVARALEKVADPHLHSAEWAPGMPPEIATAGVFERWEWMADNGVKPLSEFTRRWRGNKAREMFMAQIPVPGQWS